MIDDRSNVPRSTITKCCHEHVTTINQMLIIVWPQLPLSTVAYFNKGSDWANLLNKNFGIINHQPMMYLQPDK